MIYSAFSQKQQLALIEPLLILNNQMVNFEWLKVVAAWMKLRPLMTGAVAILALGLLYLRKIHYKFIVHPNVQGRSNKDNIPEYQHPKNRGMECEDVQIRTPDELTLRGWYIKNKNAKYLTIYYHENAGNIGTRLFFIQTLMKHVDTNVLIVAYRGFSDSEGTYLPSQKNIADDSKSIFCQALQLSKRDKLGLFVLGRSLGGYSAISTLSQPDFQQKAKGLVLQNTFTSILDVAVHLTPSYLRYLLWPITWIVASGSYNSLKRLQKVQTPTLFVKGCKDALIPKTQMDALQNLYSSLKKQNFQYLVENGTHNDTWYLGGRNYFAALNEFYRHCARL